MNYFVIDVETPNQYNDSICAVGMQTIDDGIVTNEDYSLVNPETFFLPFNISIHGITEDMVRFSPSFPKIWSIIKEMAGDRVFVAHNAPFDINVLIKCINKYSLEPYEFHYLDTVRIGRSLCKDWPRHCGAFRLPNMSLRLGVELDHHHNAMSDTRACGGILMKLLSIYKFNPEDFLSHSSSVKPEAPVLL